MELTAAQARRIGEIALYGTHVEIQPLDDYGVLVWVHSGHPPHDIGFLEVIEAKPTNRVAWNFGLPRPGV